MARGVIRYGTADQEERKAAAAASSSKPSSGFDFTQDPMQWLGSAEGKSFLEKALGGITATPRVGAAAKGPSASDILARQKFDWEKGAARRAEEFDARKYADALAAQAREEAFGRQQYADQQALQARQLAGLQNLYSTGGYRTGVDKMLEMIGAEGKRTEGDVNRAYEAALANIAAGYQTAEGLTGAGYNALEEFLRSNPNNPYANVQVSAGAAPDAMEQILSAYGVSADPVRAQVAAEQAAAQQGAAGFQNLLNVLGASAQQSDLSRLAELQMGRRLSGETLGTQRATYQSQAAKAQADALAEIQARLAQARMEQEAAAAARQYELAQAIAAAGGTPTAGGAVPPPASTPTGSSGGDGLDTPTTLPEPIVAPTVAPTVTPTVAPTVTTPQLEAPSTREFNYERDAPNLVAAGMNPQTIGTIISQGIGNPNVKGGIPDYLRVIQDQQAAAAQRALAEQLAREEEDKRRREELARIAAAQRLAAPTLGMFGME